MSLAGHVDDITAQARKVNVGRAVLSVIAAVFFAVGWLVGAVFTAVVWCAVAVKVGFVEARGRHGAA